MRDIKDLKRLIDRDNAAYSQNYSEKFLDAMMFCGDPLADGAVAGLHEQSYDRAADKLGAVRALAQAGDPRAENFLRQATQRPDWLEPGLIPLGQRVSLAFVRHTEISLTHSLFAGALFARAALVTQSTGRLGADPATRIRETGAFLAAILQPGGLASGGVGWESVVKVRLLHASIRRWLKDSPGFSKTYVGVPIDQTMLAATLSLFSYLHLRSLARLGVPLDPLELRAHHHLWRYVGWLLGVDARLLTRDLDQERELWSALVAHQTFPDLFGARYFDDAVAAITRLSKRDGDIAPFIRALYLRLSGPRWFGLANEAADDWRLPLFLSTSAAKSMIYRWLPGAPARMAARGQTAFQRSVELAKIHDFQMRIEDAGADADIARRWEDLAQGVRARFSHLAPR